MIQHGTIMICGLAAIAMAACTTQTDPRFEAAATYSRPKQSGLVAVRPYPNANDVCQVIGENDVTANYLDHTTLLIGCPANERGAIADRTRAGAKRLDDIGAWVLLALPN